MALRADAVAEPLVILGASGREGLAERYQLADTVPDAGRFNLLATGKDCLEGLRVAVERDRDVEALILVSPPPPDGSSLPGVPTLVVCGTDDADAQGRVYREQMVNCHYVLVYAAGADVARDRPAAFAALVSDFLARRERFIVNQRSGLLHP